jgi:starch phosphorylase
LLYWRQELDRHWNTVRFGPLRVETHDGQHFFQVEVSLGTLNPDQICVELYANSNDKCKSSIQSMKAPEPGADSQGMLTYSARVPATRASSDYTARIVPYHANVSVPLEAGLILWQH